MVKLPLDKQAHFWAGAAIAASVTLYTMSPLLGLAACIFFAVGKEVWDAMGHGTPDKWDAVATIAGSVVILPYAVLY